MNIAHSVMPTDESASMFDVDYYLVFGASSGKGGLGWYIFQNRNELYTDRVFAGLAAVIVIGLAVEHLVFDTVERVTVRRWGVQQ